MRAPTRVTIAGLTAAVAALVVGVPPASAATQIVLPKCCPADEVQFGNDLYVLDEPPAGNGAEAATLVRIDPGSDAITGQVRLPSGTPTGNTVDTEAMAVAAGSIWIPSYFHNEVLRINPAAMQVTARINVGRGPGSIVTEGQSVWVVIQTDGFLDRIDPATNAVVQTVAVGRRGGTDFAYQAAAYGAQLLVSLPGSGRVAHVDPDRGRIIGYDQVGADAAACARLIPASGGYWLDDTECSYSYYRWDSATAAITAEINSQPRGDWGAAVVGSATYTAEYSCNDVRCVGFLAKYDATTGVALGQRALGTGVALLPHFARHSLWVGRWDAGTVERVAVF